jgi:hypothetical protein
MVDEAVAAVLPDPEGREAARGRDRARTDEPLTPAGAEEVAQALAYALYSVRTASRAAPAGISPRRSRRRNSCGTWARALRWDAAPAATPPRQATMSVQAPPSVLGLTRWNGHQSRAMVAAGCQRRT